MHYSRESNFSHLWKSQEKMNGLLSQPQKCVCCCQGYVSWVCCLHHLHPGDIMNTCRNCIIWCKRTTMNQAWYHLFNLHPAFQYLSCYLIFLLVGTFFLIYRRNPQLFFRVKLPCLETNPCFQSNVMGIIFAISIILSGFIISKKNLTLRTLTAFAFLNEARFLTMFHAVFH